MLELIQGLRQQLLEEPFILASPEDVAYFRVLASTFDKRSDLQNTNDIATNDIAPIPSLPQDAPVRPNNSHDILNSEPAEKPPSLVLAVKNRPPEKVEAVIPPPAKPQQAKPQQAKSALREILAKLLPSLAILDQLPDDKIAKKIANRWKTKTLAAPLSLLYGEEPPAHRKFLEELTTALDVYFAQASLIPVEAIEKEKQWDAFLATEGLRLILISDATLWQMPNLRAFYKEVPADGRRLLQNVPLFLLPDPSLYFKDSLLKRSLWESLCQRLQKQCP